MKINLLYGDSSTTLNGYLNLNPYIDVETDNVKCADLKNLDQFCDSGELEELIAYNILEYFAANKLVEILNHWLSKLAIGGIITLGISDLYYIAKEFINFNISVAEFNDLVHGKQIKSFEYKRSSVSLPDIIHILQDNNFKIMQKRIDKENYVITAQRQR